MLQQYAGDNDDNGTALYAGGAFDVADPNNPWPTNSPRDLAIWDAADWWFTGAQSTDPASGVTFGFQDNPATASTNRAEIYALARTGTPPTGGPPPGCRPDQSRPGRRRRLQSCSTDGLRPCHAHQPCVLGSECPDGHASGGTLAAGATSGSTSGLGTDGLVHAIQAYDPVTFDPDGSGPLPAVPDPNNSAIPQLFVGGAFTNIAGVGASNSAFFNHRWLGAWNRRDQRHRLRDDPRPDLVRTQAAARAAAIPAARLLSPIHRTLTTC